jgi:hypothetical protein
VKKVRAAALAAAALLAVTLPIPASAHSSAEPELQEIKAVEGLPSSRGPVASAGIGNGVYAKFNQLSLFQCPYTFCNQGVVHDGLPLPADDVAAICQLSWNSPRGNHWVLLLSHQNNHVGFADIGDVVSQGGSFTPPLC